MTASSASIVRDIAVNRNDIAGARKDFETEIGAVSLSLESAVDLNFQWRL
jgi:hypothetical protein